MPASDSFSGVSNCYVFKSRLQEYAQKVGLPTPVYETSKEGPSHEPSFKSTVILNNVRYDSLPGFFNRKAAEQSAAEVALLELAKTGEINASISQPVHETGLCKNLLQEYAQKMNYAIPLYECRKDESVGKVPLFSCTVEIGGIRYIGATARNKKEAEIKAARTALLAIQSSRSESGERVDCNSQLTVVPCKKRGPEIAIKTEDTVNMLKAKKVRFKKKASRRKVSGKKPNNDPILSAGNLNLRMDGAVESMISQVVDGQMAVVRDEVQNLMRNDEEKCMDMTQMNYLSFHDWQQKASMQISVVSYGDTAALPKDLNGVSGVE